MSLEYPPVGIAGPTAWAKDTSDTVEGLAKYKTKVTTASYGNGWYVAEANTVYAYNNATAYGGDEWPPSGAFDKTNGGTGLRSGWSTDPNVTLTNLADATSPPYIVITMPNFVKMTSYEIMVRTDGALVQAPTKWTLQGSRDCGTTWTTIVTQTTSTAWTTDANAGARQSFTQNVSRAYHAFKFIFLRNSSSTPSVVTVGEIRIFGTPEVSLTKMLNDGYPSALTSANSFGMPTSLVSRLSSFRGLSGVPSVGQIRFSDFVYKYAPSDSLFPSVPFRLVLRDGANSSFVRVGSSICTLNTSHQHIYFNTESIPGSYTSNNKPGYMYYLKDVSSALYLRHTGLWMYMSTGPLFTDFAFRATPANNDPGSFYLRNPFSVDTSNAGTHYIGLSNDSGGEARLRIGELTANPMIVKTFTFDTSDMPPVTNGLIGMYTAESYNGSQWTDISMCNNHATVTRGTISQNRTGIANRDYLTGGTTAGIQFPSGSLPAAYTLFHVTKYNGGNRGRIFDGLDNGINWWSGFHNGASGKSFHFGNLITRTDITQNENNTTFPNIHGDDWVVSTDMKNLYRSNKTNRATFEAPTTTTTGRISINYGNLGEYSDWASAAVVLYNRSLTLSEVIQMENWLIAKYNTSIYPPIIHGMVGMYTGESWDYGNSRWADISGNDNHVTVGGTITRNYSGFGGRNFLSGTTSSTLLWPTGILPANYTLFHVAKYNGATRRRIFNGFAGNWLSGFWNFGGNILTLSMSGVSHHNSWLTQYTTDLHGSNWVLSTDQNTLYRSQRVLRSAAFTGAGSSERLCVNLGTFTESSDWAIAAVIVYNRKLSEDEINQVENWLAQRYNIVDGTTSLITDRTIQTLQDPPLTGLTLWLDAMNHAPVFQTWVNQVATSSISYNFNINASAYRTDGIVPHMNFEGGYGLAKRPDIAPNRSGDVPCFANATMVVFTSIKDSTSAHRTLIRGAANDHQVIVQSGTTNLGMWDNDTEAQFLSCGFDIVNLPTPYTSFNMLVFKLSQSSPYFQFTHGLDSTSYNITDGRSTFTSGFSSIGGFHNYTNEVTDGSQYWGNVGTFLYYNRFLTMPELQDIYNQYKTRYNFPHPGDTRFFDTGTWNVLYEVTAPRCDANGMIRYTVNNSGNLQGKSHSRVAYYMQNRMNNTVLYYGFVSMDSNANIRDYRVPDSKDGFTRKVNTTNLRIFSNHPQVGNFQVSNGRVEIWNWDYSDTTTIGDGSETIHDYDDTPLGIGSYGSFQIHDMTNKKTLLAWNNHNSSADGTVDIGIGNNDSTNIHNKSTTTSTDWTGAYNGAYNWKLQVLVNTDKNCMDRISAAARQSLVGGYSTHRLSSTYTGPTVRIRRDNDDLQRDFYADEGGNMGTSVGATGQSLANWLSGATGYVVTWYDQSGRGNNATQASPSLQPIIDLVNDWLDFKTNKYMNLPNGTIPAGNTNYTVITRHNTISHPSCILYGGTASNKQGFGLERENEERYINWWWVLQPNDIWGFPPGFTGNTLSVVYNSMSGRRMFVNGTLTAQDSTVARETTNTNNTIGTDHRNRLFNGELYYLYIFSSALSDADRTLCEELGQIITTNLTLYFDPQNLNCYSGSGTTLIDLSGNGNNGTLVTGASVSNGSVLMNGTTGFVSTTYNPMFYTATNYTYEVWFKDNAVSGGTGAGPYALVSNSSTDDTWNRLSTLLLNSDGTINGFERDIFKASWLPNSTNVVNGKWRHVVKSCVANDRQYLYIDGVQISSVARTTELFSHAGSIMFGGGFTNNFQNWRIGPMRIYFGKALTQTEVFHNYTVERRKFAV